ncbi:FG-GAP repeat protein [Stieleria bergensis]|uniref:FG-GAP repeat protein n=1 Tax=Stieleria bergensis TaxID=2528025 RepID=A0A517SXX9_9BACT|nr:FG-GAP repeat protein [Planctomycetes bacterium SV_7m_r]
MATCCFSGGKGFADWCKLAEKPRNMTFHLRKDDKLKRLGKLIRPHSAGLSTMPVTSSKSCPVRAQCSRSPARWRRCPLGSVALLAILLSTQTGCNREQTPKVTNASKPDPIVATSSETTQTDESKWLANAQPMVQSFCADCHAMPHAESYTKKQWAAVISRGYDHYRLSGRQDLVLPSPAQVERYFVAYAPEAIDLPPASALNLSAAVVPHHRYGMFGKRVRPARVADIQWCQLTTSDSQNKTLVYCDEGGGTVNLYQPGNFSSEVSIIARMISPSQIVCNDINRDGQMDFLVMDQGRTDAVDTSDGRLFLLSKAADQDHYAMRVLINNLAAETVVTAGDFDGDGDQDVVVAQPDSLVLLDHVLIADDGQPIVNLINLDAVPDLIALEASDFNQDGKVDLVALQGRQHERVILLRNEGKHEFIAETLFDADNPAFGCSDFEIVDLDQDADLDILLCNGDFGDQEPRADQGIYWLENNGDGELTSRELFQSPGIYSAQAGDFDGDGDLDVMTVAQLPSQLSKRWIARGASPLVMLQQRDGGQFIPLHLSGRLHESQAISCGDFNDDGMDDIAIGNYFAPHDPESRNRQSAPDLLIWQSQ